MAALPATLPAGYRLFSSVGDVQGQFAAKEIAPTQTSFDPGGWSTTRRFSIIPARNYDPIRFAGLTSDDGAVSIPTIGSTFPGGGIGPANPTAQTLFGPFADRFSIDNQASENRSILTVEYRTAQLNAAETVKPFEPINNTSGISWGVGFAEVSVPVLEARSSVAVVTGSSGEETAVAVRWEFPTQTVEDVQQTRLFVRSAAPVSLLDNSVNTDPGFVSKTQSEGGNLHFFQGTYWLFRPKRIEQVTDNSTVANGSGVPAWEFEYEWISDPGIAWDDTSGLSTNPDGKWAGVVTNVSGIGFEGVLQPWLDNPLDASDTKKYIRPPFSKVLGRVDPDTDLPEFTATVRYKTNDNGWQGLFGLPA